MGGDGRGDRFSASVPARPELVGTLRVFASAVARHYGLADELVEDVKLAVSEAATGPIDAAAGGEVRVTIDVDDPGLVLAVSSRPWNAGAAADVPDGVDPAVLDRVQLVRALFGDVERTEADGVVTVRFSTGARVPG